MKETSVLDIPVPGLSGETVHLKEQKGKVLLIVNTASKCGFTPQLDELEKLREEFAERGFEILAFPSNDFAGQEPLEGEEIRDFCQTVYGSTFPVYGKVHVKGPEAHPFFKQLAKPKSDGGAGAAPKWNFTKYLVDREGNVVTYFFPFTKPSANRVKRAISKLL